MARDKKKKGALATITTGNHAKARHKRDRKGNVIDWAAPMPPGLVAIPDKPQLSKKYKTWYEAVENKDKKKRLEFEFTQSRQPPPGMEFVPIGNPALTTLCKELSRERDAMIFIVTSSAGVYSVALSFHLNRVGHHFRESIVEEARKTLGDDQLIGANAQLGLPEPIPERQEDITRQADAAIRDLFPRIPHTDRQMILDHAFNKARIVQSKEPPPVGLAADITLSRRVQLAVLAHIRHNHTRYDQLLKETSWVNARKAVESLCLDYLVKWRGDEETGRDQLDEILYEVIVISDSESDDEDDEDDDEDDSSDTSVAGDEQEEVNWQPPSSRASQPRAYHSTALPAIRPPPEQPRGDTSPRVARTERRAIRKNQQKDRKAAKWAQRGFSRYQAARDVAWSQAVERQRLEPRGSVPSAASMANGRSASHGPLRIEHSARLEPNLATARSPQKPICYSRAPFDQHNGVREPVSRPGYVDAAQRISADTSSHAPEATRPHDHRNAAESGYGPLIGTRPYPYRQVDQASHYHVHDPKDYVLQSIEPASPTRFPVQHSSSATVSAPMRYMTDGTDAPNSRPAEPQNYRTLGGDEGFVRLPPRSDRSRMPNEPVSSSLQPLRTHADNVPRHNAGAPLRSEARPIYVEDSGLVCRSEARPIYIDGTPAPAQRPWAESMQPQPDTRPFAIRGVADVRPPGPADVGRHDGRYADDRFQPMDRLRGDFIELVRVSNNFPRRHELSPIPVDTRDFDARPIPVNSLSQGVERVVAIERPIYLPEHVSRVPVYEQGDFIRLPPRPERHERVIGIEYRQAHPGHDRGYAYEAGDQYQSYTTAGPMPYPVQENQQPRFVRQVPRNGEVITID